MEDRQGNFIRLVNQEVKDYEWVSDLIENANEVDWESSELSSCLAVSLIHTLETLGRLRQSLEVG
jgi:hypothetical protein